MLLVFLGGGLGSMLRFLLSKTYNPLYTNFYLGTFLANSIGCLIIGLLLGLSAKQNLLTQNQTLLLATGFCGGFTTFSSFAFENFTFLKAGEILNFSIYTLSSMIIGIIAVALGIWISKLI